ncbi:MAG TPA: TonB-dependent receptor [Bacteroidales bacterium]|nr:TonB-dependent receptor [Bacteroidales bacterium]HQG53528.1 TonB-dependent receptor [Bacteroidales bacterium]
MKKKLIRSNKLLTIFLLFMCIMLNANTYAQQISITGKVTIASTNEPLPGATVVEKGTTNGTTTGIDGSYKINVQPNATLVFSFVGMVTQEIPVGQSTRIDVSMVESVGVLEEIVVTGYQTQRKVDLTGSISVVNVKELAERPAANPMQTLQGRVPGLYIETSGDPTGRTRTLLIRGINTLGDRSPLYIIDGVPTKDAKTFSYLDPNAIESMQVLKDAAAASVYGSRASNGVIIVTTKKGKGKLKIDFSSSQTAQNLTRRLAVCNTEEYGRALWQASINDGTSPTAHASRYSYEWHVDPSGVAVLDKVIPVEWIGGTEESGMKSADTDWQDVVFRQGWINSNDLTISGSTEQSSLLVNLGYLKNKGVIMYNDFEKISGRINSSTSFFNKKVTFGENLSIANTSEIPLRGDHNGPGIANFNSQTVISNTYFMQPILPVYYVDGFPHFSGPYGSGFSDRNNPLQICWLGRDNRVKDLLLFGDLYLEIDLIKNLKLRSSFGINYDDNTKWALERTWQAGFLGRSINYYEKFRGDQFNWNWTNTANYRLVFNKHTADILLGMEAIANDYKTMHGYKEGFADQSYEYFTVFSAGTGVDNVYGTWTGNQLLSYFGKINYNWADRYLVSATVRYDGSSRFGEENRFGLFPAVSLGWRINQEPFLADVKFISNLKLRAGAGTVGNQEIGDEARFGLYSTYYGATSGNLTRGTAYDLNGAGTGSLPSGYVLTQLENKKLKWESTDEVNLGLDFGFLNERITGSFDYFFRKTKDILTRPPYPGAMGEGSYQYVNGATMENKGFELILGYRGKTNDFSYNVQGSISSFHDKITYLPESVVRSYPGNVEKTILGRSVTSVFGYITDGIFQNQAEVDAHCNQPGKGIGRLRYKDLNNDGKIDTYDQDWIGESLPKFEYGINADLSYKNFSLTIFGQGVYGITVYDGVKGSTDFTFGQGMNFGKRVLKAWTPQNTSSKIPMLSLVNSNNETRTSNYFWVKGDYFKVRNATLSYTLPKIVSDKIKVGMLRVYIMGENFILLRPKGDDAFTGPDPETPGTIYPRPVSYTIGINLTI